MIQKEIYNELNAKKVIENLEKRNIQGFFVKTKKRCTKKSFRAYSK